MHRLIDTDQLRVVDEAEDEDADREVVGGHWMSHRSMEAGIEETSLIRVQLEIKERGMLSLLGRSTHLPLMDSKAAAVHRSTPV